VLTLNALAIRRATAANFPVVPAKSLHTPSRLSRLEHEVLAAGAAFVALQDIDSYESVWSPALKRMGYDVAVARRDDDAAIW